MVLPGAQALLGFQLATMLLEGFDQLPPASKYLHLVSLAWIALSTILLMAPAAYHRLVEQGEETERFHGVASQMVLAAMVPLALGAGPSTPTNELYHRVILVVLLLGLVFLFTAHVRTQLQRHTT